MTTLVSREKCPCVCVYDVSRISRVALTLNRLKVLNGKGESIFPARDGAHILCASFNWYEKYTKNREYCYYYIFLLLLLTSFFVTIIAIIIV